MDDNVICVLAVEKSYDEVIIEDAYTSVTIPSATMMQARKAIHQDEADGKIRIDSEYYEVDDFYEVTYFNIAGNYQDKVRYKIHYISLYK